nr:hypothetical protein Iba_chr06bCG2020 [Ipomoea batatas]
MLLEVHPTTLVIPMVARQISPVYQHQPDPTIMLLMGMKISLTKNPTNPITTNPIAVRTATFENSTRSGLWHLLTRRTLSFAKSLRGSNTESKASIFVENFSFAGER